MSSLPSNYRAAFIESKGAKLTFKEVDLKHPGPRQVLVKVLACGVCFSDHAIARGDFGDVFPRVPGHELVGDVVEVGEEVTRFKVGDRVGGPWHGGHDGVCRACQRGQFQMCDNAAVNGATHDGGYAEYVLLRTEAVVPIPKSMNPSDIAPLLCAGVTVFNSMRKLHIEQGNLVAIQGLGGLGHLAVQYASKMGYKVAAISSSPDKRDFAKELGAHVYIDTSKEDAAEQLKDMGGAAAIITTAPSPKAVQGLTGGLQACGKLLVLAPVGNVEFNTVDLVLKGATVQGWPAGHALDVEETLAFSELHGVKAYVEKFPLDKVQDATDHMLSGKVRFRSVLEMN